MFQALLDAKGPLARNTGVNVVLVRLEDMAPAGDPPKQLFEPSVRGGARELSMAITTSAVKTHVPHLLFTTLASPQMAEQHARFLSTIELWLTNELKATPGVYFTASTELESMYPVAAYADPRAEELGRVPYTPLYYAALGTAIARKIHALRSPPKKVIALDCDDTLWSGVVGEDGPDGIVLDPPHLALQQRMVIERDAGMLLALASKNNEADVSEAFARRREMPLREEHFAAMRLAWRPKSEGLRAIADKLAVGLDSFVFFDDNPVEIAEVEASCPEILSLALPKDPAAIPDFLRNIWPLDHLKLTAEDRARAERYRDNARRERQRVNAPTLEEFLAGLDLEITTLELTPENTPAIARVAQLTQRTNQFNATTIRRTESELAQLLERGALEGLAVEVKDKLGNYGLVGAILFSCAEKMLEVDTFLLSCRALGKRVEHEMLRKLGEKARTRNLSGISVRCIPTEKNRPALDFFESMRTAGKDLVPGVELAISIDADTPDRSPPRTSSLPPRVALPARFARSALYARIAGELTTPEKIWSAIESARMRTRPSLSSPYSAPETAMEDVLATELAGVLGISRAGIDDNFFELGGTSLTAVQLISRVRESLGIDIPIDRFFAGPTVRRLAALCEDLAAHDSSDGLAARLLELDQMSDEEAEAWLEAELRGRSGVSRPAPRPASKTGVSEAPAIASGRIAALGLITRDRPRALERALASYIDHAKAFGRGHHLIVADDTSSAEARARTRRMIAELARRTESHIYYAGDEEKSRYAESLIALGLPRDAVRFALFDTEGTNYSVGANRNALLLDGAGELCFITDDDTICRAGMLPFAKRSLAICSGLDPAEVAFFSDRDSALAAVPPADVDFLALHEELLGKDLASICNTLESKPPVLEQVDRALRARLESREGRTLATFNGLAGDCAWGAPFGFWGTPMGCLVLGDSSHARLVRTPEDYRLACTTREIVRSVSRPTISDGAHSMCTFVGLDNRELLPPFFPVQRGQDVLFGLMLWRCFEHAWFGHVACTLLHSPLDERRFSPGEIFRTAASFDTAKLMFAAVASWTDAAVTRSNTAIVSGAGANTRIRELGAHLEALGKLAQQAFEEQIRAQASIINEESAAQLDAHVARHKRSPEQWSADVSKYAELLRRAASRADYCVPLDLVKGGDVETARALAKRLVAAFGRLLNVWPDLVAGARELRARGERLAVRIAARKRDRESG